MEKIRIEQHSFGGMMWVAGWLFTIGFLKLTFWKGVLAIVIVERINSRVLSPGTGCSTNAPQYRRTSARSGSTRSMIQPGR